MDINIITPKTPSKELINQIFDLHSKKLGSGYITKESIIKSIKNKNLLVAMNAEEVIGYLKFSICTEKEFFINENLNLNGDNQKILALNTCAVKYEKQGIGTALNNFAINSFASQIKKIYCPVWTSKNGTNAHKLLTNFGFSKIKEFPNFWYNDSINKKDFCPVCGCPCTCELDLYYKEI